MESRLLRINSNQTLFEVPFHGEIDLILQVLKIDKILKYISRIATILKYDGEFVCSGTLVSMQEVVTGTFKITKNNNFFIKIIYLYFANLKS